MSRSVRRALLLVSSERYLVMCLNVGLIAIASRLLTPGEIGIAALGLSVMLIADAVRDFGTSSYIVRAEELTEIRARSALTMGFLISFALALLVAASAHFIASYYHEPRLVPYFQVVALNIAVTPLSSALLAILRREMQFFRAAIVGIASVLVYVIGTVILIVLGGSYMSFAWAGVMQSVAAGLLALVLCPRLWILKPHLGEWRSVLAFGSASTAVAIIYRIYESLPLLALGRTQSSASVGLFSRAMTIYQLPDKIAISSLSSVALPAIAEHHRSGHSLKEPLLAALSYVGVLLWPCYLLIALLAEPIVLILLGHQWLDIVPLVRIMSIAGLFTLPSVLLYSVLVVISGINDMLRATLLTIPLCAVITIIAALHGPIALAASQLLTVPLQAVIGLQILKSRVGFTWRELGLALTRSLLVSAACIASAMVVAFLPDFSLKVTITEAILVGVAGVAGWLAGAFAFSHPIRADLKMIAQLVLRSRRSLSVA